MDSPVPDASTGSGAAGGEEDDEDEDDSEALKAHIAKMKAGGDASAGNGEALARSVKCSEVCSCFAFYCSLDFFPSVALDSSNRFELRLGTFATFPDLLFTDFPIGRADIHLEQCGKIFKNADLVSFHAEKSGHSNFEESTEEVR
jgi:hypothetical protein